MAENKSELTLSAFYPEENLKITEIVQQPERILIKMKSITHTCNCPGCNQNSNKYHGTYIRKVQDLPILGKRVMLYIKAYEYENPDCQITSFAENFNGFLNSYSRMTERLVDFICTLALETSCEGCAKICRETGIQISGDTVIRLLLKRYESQPSSVVGDVIGIDDFAYKKRHIYGNIIVNEENHEPVTLLEGRDGETLRAWLKENKHVWVITHDRASAYVKVIAEELPDVMQIADRFHLHQNLLEAVKKALNSYLPSTLTIPKDTSAMDDSDEGKKIEPDVDNLQNYCLKRYQTICQIQQFLKEGCSYREIARRMGIGTKTIAKYCKGDPKELSMYGMKQSKLDPYYDFIVRCLQQRFSKSKTVKALYEKGYTGSRSNAFDYLCKIENKLQAEFEPQPYIRTMTECLKYKAGSVGMEKDYITWEGVFRHMWMNTKLTEEHKEYICEQYL